MEKFESKNPPKEKQKQISNMEQRQKLLENIKNLHREHFELSKQIEDLRKKYKHVTEKRGELVFQLKLTDMSPEDSNRYQELEKEMADLMHRVEEVTKDTLISLSDDEKVEWKKMPYTGTIGALAETNSRHYRSYLDENYALEISWFNYGEDIGARPEQYRESYSARIRGLKEVVVKKGIGGVIGRKIREDEFPFDTVGVHQNEQREFEPDSDTKRNFSEQEVEEIKESLLRLGGKLRERLK